MEVHRVMSAFGVGADEACRRVSRGDKVPVTWRWLDRDGTIKAKRAHTVGSPWKNIKPGTLARRYWRWRKTEENVQVKKPTDKN